MCAFSLFGAPEYRRRLGVSPPGQLGNVSCRLVPSVPNNSVDSDMQCAVEMCGWELRKKREIVVGKRVMVIGGREGGKEIDR